METFIDQGYLPNFKRLRDTSQVFITDAEEVAPNLDPWIQWVTVHSGLSFDQHGIHHLGDGHKLPVNRCGHDRATGKRVWVCGSMNIKYEVPSPVGGSGPMRRRERAPIRTSSMRTTCSCSGTFRSTPTPAFPSRKQISYVF